ncbi:hypothetical protein SAMN05421783_103172 [Thiocapsa roseopersicina]|uniref:Uncharacterized protein n=1 Tax=Thiocapsa roseopersicina TaxID=1058 RepID=A0A1H2SVG3_THIRO|nr:hypothetical protein SAMN05421783_103172 [Thiocapsa roseopersicina]
MVGVSVVTSRAVTADTALPPGALLRDIGGVLDGSQADDDLEEARKRPGERLDRDVRPRAACTAL